MNNWLGFSLSPQELQEHPVPHLGFNSYEISTAHGESSCFDLPSDSSVLSSNLPAPTFGILEDFNRNTHSQVWNMNTFSCSSHDLEDQSKPKLENFLGVHQEQKSSNLYHQLNLYQETDAASHTSWLSNNPVPPHAAEDNEAAAPAAAQSLSLSMSTNSQTSSLLPPDIKLGSAAVEGQTGAVESAPRRSIDTFGQRTSIYRGVTRHRWTGRYEAHLWDNSCRREGQSRKGRQVYLGGYDKEDKAARSYDLVALKYWGASTTTNFPMSNYEKEIEEMKHMTRQEFVASIRRKSSGFSRGASIYRGVTRHHQHGRWQARIGRVAGNKDLYLGTFTTEEEAAEAYDVAAIKFRGLTAVTNFEMNRYDVKSILDSATLPIRGAAKRLKDVENDNENGNADLNRVIHESNLNLRHGQTSGYGNNSSAHGWPSLAFHPLSMYPYEQQMLWCKQEPDPYAVYGNNGSEDGSGVSMMSGNQSHGNGFVGEGKTLDYGSMLGSADGYYHQQARNLYYQQQMQSSSDLVKGGSNLYDRGSASTNWIPTDSTTNKEGGSHGASTFITWNDT